ncbi:mucin-2-like [Ylistrum balloti]|uniref:mucin-2-like n=1 Tax=Ylistrum balloti TaxID=509963 RepID=UPI002905BDFF|nr:mucin-2-like [Ylistrum balloti]
MAVVKKPVVGTGKLLIDKNGKLLVQGDDKVALSNPNESHKLISQKKADGTSNLFMIPSEGVNKGKYFLVVPEKEMEKLNMTTSDVLSSNASHPPANPNSSATPGQASHALSAVLKNIADHISSESKACDDATQSNDSGIRNPSVTRPLEDTGTNLQTSTASSFIPSGASMEQEYQTSQGPDARTSTVSSIVPVLNVTQASGGITGSQLTLGPSLKSIPFSSVTTVPSLPSSKPVIILTSATIPAVPQETCSNQTLLATSDSPSPLTRPPIMATCQQSPNVVFDSTPSQSPSLTTTLTSNQTTTTTTSSIPLFPKIGVSTPSQQVPLIPVLINTNQIITSASSFLQSPMTTVPASSHNVSSILNTQTSNSLCTLKQVPVVVSSQEVSLVPVKIAPKQSNVTTVSNFQQPPVPAVTQSPIFVTPQQALTLLGKTPVLSDKALPDTVASLIKTMQKTPVPYTVSNATRPQQSPITSAACQSTRVSTVSHNSGPTTAATSKSLESTPMISYVTTSGSDRYVYVPVPGTLDGNRVLISNKAQKHSSDVTLTCSSSAVYTTTKLQSEVTSANSVMNVVRPQMSTQNIGTSLSNATPMMLFSHNAAQNLKPTNLANPLKQQDSNEIQTSDVGTSKMQSLSAVSHSTISSASQSLRQQGLPPALNVKKIYKLSASEHSTTNTPKTITVLKIPISKEHSSLQRYRLGSAIASSPATSISVSMSCNVAPCVRPTKTDQDVGTTASNLNVQNAAPRIISTQTASSTKTSCTLSYSSAVNVHSYSKLIFTPVRNSGQTTLPVNDRVTGVNGRRILQKPKIIISENPIARPKQGSTIMGNLVSIVPSNGTKMAVRPSLVKTYPHNFSSIVNAIKSDKNEKNVSNPVFHLSRDNGNNAGSTQLHSTSCSTQMMTNHSNTLSYSHEKKDVSDMQIVIDSVFSLSSEDQNENCEKADNANESCSKTSKNPSENLELNQRFESKSTTDSGQSMGQILREFDHLSNFNGVVLPDEAITESKIFSPCYVVLDTLHMHGGTMEGINTRCSRACRQNFLSKKSEVRVAIHKKESVSMQARSERKAAVVDNPLLNKEGNANVRSNVPLPDAGKIRMQRSRDILRAELDAAAHVAVSKTNRIKKDESKQTPSTTVSSREKDDMSDTKQSSSCSALHIVKKLTNSDQFYLIRVDGKTVVIPHVNTGNKPKAFIINDDKFNLGSFTADQTSSPNATVASNERVLPSVSTKSPCIVSSNVNTKDVPGAVKPVKTPTTTSTHVNIKPEPVTYGYGDETNTQPPLIVKQERMDRGYSDEPPKQERMNRGYSDEPPKLERMDTEPPKRTSRELKSKRDSAAPDLIAEDGVAPAKIQKVMSKEERINSLKELLKKQEKDLEEMRQRRFAETTPADRDL